MEISFSPPLCLHHITGGINLLIDQVRLGLFMPSGTHSLSPFSLLSDESVFSLLEKHKGLRLLAMNHFRFAEEMNDPITDNFILAVTGKKRCIAEEQFHYWRGISHALHEDGRASDSLISSRVASQIGLCIKRLEALSTAYRTTLLVNNQNSPPDKETFQLTSDKYAHRIGSEYRSLLNELYSLRDAILAATFRLSYNQTTPYALRYLKPFVLAKDTLSGRLISDSMYDEDGSLYIQKMSLYRAVGQHCLGSNNPVLSDVYKLQVSDGPFGQLPFIIYPLYDDFDKMKEIETESPKGVLEIPSREETIRFASLPNHTDALEFSYDCFVNLLTIASAVAEEAKIPPRVMQLNDTNMLELSFTDEDGKRVHLKRDEATGLLARQPQ